ncbi:MAG: hypothetical protein ACI3XR_10040, partial [Eubacteriales bacterium]
IGGQAGGGDGCAGAKIWEDIMYIVGKIIKYVSIMISTGGFMGFMLILIWLVFFGGRGMIAWILTAVVAMSVGLIGYFVGDFICFKNCIKKWEKDHGGKA